MSISFRNITSIQITVSIITGEIMTCRGFLTESKSFMIYSNMDFLNKVKFWVKFPYTYLKYVKLMNDYRVKQMLRERKQAEEG